MTSPAAPQTLADLVMVRRRFARSAHLQRDWQPQEGADDQTGYHLTPCAHELLAIVDGARERPADRALTIVGPYGAGKSAFCVFLAGLVSGGESESRLLGRYDAPLAQSLGADARRLIPVPIVGSRAPLGAPLVNGLKESLQAQAPVVARVLADEGAFEDASSLTSRAIADLYARAAQLATERGLGGLLLLLDELGKFLEYAALHPTEGDIFTLQELAEAAARSSAPLLVVAVLHQNAEAYAQKLGRAHQAEWAKVGERFREVPFFPSDAERMDMVGYALQHAPELHLNGNFSSLAIYSHGHLPPSLAARFGEMARAAYPLHPAVLLALPALFRKTGQSHRSLFNFLAGEEAHALGRFIRDSLYTPAAPPLFMLDRLFDYAAEVLLGGWSAGTLARLWAEATATVERASSVSSDARRVLKCIALLGLLRDPQLPASLEVLTWALMGTDGNAPNVEAALRELTERQLIAWSRTRELYRLWEGGDVDIEAALETARSGLGSGISLRAATDRDLCPLPRLIARRHSFETGTLRAVETRPCNVTALAAILGQGDELKMVLCLAEGADETKHAQTLAREQGGAHALVVIARETEILREAGRDVAASGEVAAHTPALQSDRAARRELAARRFEAENAFRDEWQRCFGPTSPDARWFYDGEEIHFRNARELSAFLSRMADAVYSATPILRNELINRNALSSAAAAGRRALIEAMWLHGERERLGIEKFPPEFSMYECVLRATGLHRQNEAGVWEWGAPTGDDAARLSGVWEAMGAWIFGNSPAPRPLTDLWKLLAAPPLGLSQGVMPVLLAAFLLAHPHEISLYREGTFLSEIGVPDWEVLLRRPELFSVAGCRLQGAPREFVAALGQWLGAPGFLVPVVRELLARSRRLPIFAWKTARLPADVRRLRAALENARSPEKLLFEEIPAALDAGTLFGLAPQSDPRAQAQTLARALEAAFEQWTNAYPTMLAGARDALLQACGFVSGDEGWKHWCEAARTRAGRVINATVAPVVARGAASGADVGTLEAVLALIAGRAPQTWSDADLERFALQIERFGALYRAEIEAPAFCAAPPDAATARGVAASDNEKPTLSRHQRAQCDELSAEIELRLAALAPSLRRAVLQRLLEQEDAN